MKCPKCGTEVTGKISPGWIAVVVIITFFFFPLGLLLLIPAKISANKCHVCGTKVVKEYRKKQKAKAKKQKEKSKKKH